MIIDLDHSHLGPDVMALRSSDLRRLCRVTSRPIKTWSGITRRRRRVLERNGSHQGVMIQCGARERGERCPRCHVEMCRVRVGGRTTFFCPQHQR